MGNKQVEWHTHYELKAESSKRKAKDTRLTLSFQLFNANRYSVKTVLNSGKNKG